MYGMLRLFFFVLVVSVGCVISVVSVAILLFDVFVEEDVCAVCVFWSCGICVIFVSVML